jgi:ABC-type cobalamin/Fe3+-siderophores transport system ATPase subunit
MDEPTAFLDYKNKAELLHTIRDLATAHQKTIILSTHDISAALPCSDRAFLISESGNFIEVAGAELHEQQVKDHLETN